VPIVGRLLAAGADPCLEDEAGRDAAAAARNEHGPALDKLLPLFGQPAPPPAPAPMEYEDVVRHVRSVERRVSTISALQTLVERFQDGQPLAAAEWLRSHPEADATPVLQAERLLDAASSSLWAAPLRAMLRERLRAARIEELYALYESATEEVD
jgi:hypothetical protein